MVLNHGGGATVGDDLGNAATSDVVVTITVVAAVKWHEGNRLGGFPSLLSF